MSLESPLWWTAFVFAWWILLPAYAANAFPPLARGKHPLDFGRKLRRHRIFGDGKTWEGTILGLVAGTGVGALETAVQAPLNAYAAIWGLTLPPMSLFIGFMIALGAICGDLAGSFLKRRLGKERGTHVPLLDQLNFVIGATVFSMWFTQITVLMFVWMLILTPALHRLVNIIGHRVGVKQVPW